MNVIKWAVASTVVAIGLAAPVLVAGPASATPGFACPGGSDSIPVAYAFTPDNQPLLAGTVCVYTGTTTFRTLDVESGWQAEVKSDGSKGRTIVRFAQATTGQRVELRYEPGRTEIK